MKNVLLLSFLFVAFLLPVFGEEPPAPPAAPAEPAAAVAAPAEPPAAPDADMAKLEGTVVEVKGKDGAPDEYKFKTADAELTLLPGDKLTELLKVEKYGEKTFVLEGKKETSKDQKSEGFMIKSFEEKKAEPAPAAPETK